MKTVAVCVINYNTRDLLRECLHSVLPEAVDEVLVVDSASTDGSVEMLKTEFPSISVIALEKNKGFGSAANRGVAGCRSEHIVLLNADTRLTPGSLQVLNTYLGSHPRAGAIGPRILNPDGRPQTSCFHFPTPIHVFLYISGLYQLIPHLPLVKERSLQRMGSESARAVPWILGAAIAFRREMFEALAGFDEAFFLYFEEVDLCYRLYLQGQEVHFVPQAEIIHVGGASTGQQRSWSYIQFFASLAQFYRKHYAEFMLTGMVFIVKVFSLFKLAWDFLLLRMTPDGAARAALVADLAIQRELLFAPWQRRSKAEMAAGAA